MTSDAQSQDDKNEYLLGFASTQRQSDPREALLPVDPQRSTVPYGLVLVDASADVSSSMLANPRLRMLPLALRWPGRTVLERSPRSRRRHLGRERLRGALVAAPTAQTLAYRLYPPLAINADWLIHLGTRREMVDAATPLRELLTTHADEIRELRLQRGLEPRLEVALVDSGTLLAGTALHARIVLQMLDAGLPPAQVAQHAQELRRHTRLWLLPRHPGDVLDTLRRMPQREMLAPWEQACAGPLNKLLRRTPLLLADAEGLSCTQHAKNWRVGVEEAFAQVSQALREHGGVGAWLQISLDGSLRELQGWPAFDALRRQAVESRTMLHVTHMSPAGRIWASTESLSMALYLPPPAASAAAN